ncbi:hypothetical protein [Sulfurimonas hydrogeniphila]|uniref:hypothetical protein n=1 Tax=Sulfurimonas TaxID=202746 RepID=UPI00125F2DA1|nr:hypothetical protein [Sulfurimonas hydrogeniphila]
MARPSKKTLELRKKILDTEIFKRDNSIYETLNDIAQDSNKYSIAYYFSLKCFSRNPDRGRGNIVADIIEEKMKSDLRKEQAYILLRNLNEDIAEYYLTVLKDEKLFYQDKEMINNKYFIENELEVAIIKNALSKDRTKYFFNELISLTLNDMTDNEFIDFPLTKIEKNEIINSLNEHGWRADKTIIHLSVLPNEIESILNDNKNKNVFAELDLTKSKEEILEYVSKLKDDFDDDPSQFPNAYEFLGEKQEVFSCDLKQCDIYKDTRSLKPINGRLSDVLFIYDCKKVNEILGADVFTNEYITDEINRYWQEIKNISTDGFHSLDEYYALAKEYINNQKYKDYLTGIKHPL